MTDPIPFATLADWTDWLAANPDAKEVWVLYHKKSTGLPSIDWPQAVEGALAHGWIDGIRKTLDETQWIQRFTPRKPGSIWSAKNVATAERLIAEGRMSPAGLAAVQAGKASGQWDLAYAGGGEARRCRRISSMPWRLRRKPPATPMPASTAATAMPSTTA